MENEVINAKVNDVRNSFKKLQYEFNAIKIQHEILMSDVNKIIKNIEELHATQLTLIHRFNNLRFELESRQ